METGVLLGFNSPKALENKKGDLEHMGLGFADPTGSRDRLGAHPVPRLSHPIPFSLRSPTHKTPPGPMVWFPKPLLPGVRVFSWKTSSQGGDAGFWDFPGMGQQEEVPMAAPSTPPASASRGASALPWVWVWVRLTVLSSQPPPVTGPGGKY